MSGRITIWVSHWKGSPADRMRRSPNMRRPCGSTPSTACLQQRNQVEEGLLIHRLHRAGDVAVALLERILWASARAEQIFQRLREEIGKRRRASLPGVGRLVAVMAEVGEVQLEAAVRSELHDLAHLVQLAGLAVRREAHHLVLIAIVREAEILGQRLVEEPKRMREVDAPLYREFVTAADAPGRAGEVA